MTQRQWDRMMRAIDTTDYDHSREEPRPKRKGEKSEARRIEEGFRLLNGEGVYADDEVD